MNFCSILKATLLFCVLTIANMAFANQSLNAQGWYDKMVQHAPKALYEGIFTHQSGNQIQNVEIVHGMAEGEIWERLMHLDGPVREVIRRGDALYCIRPDASVEQIKQQGSAPFGNKPLGSVRQLAAAYEFKLLGKQRIAGRLVMGLQLLPKGRMRHAYRLWVDQETYVPLRTELLTLKGQVLERYQFSYFSVAAEFEASKFAPRTGGITLDSAQSQQVLKASSKDILEWRLNWVPAGFVSQAVTGNTPKLSARRMYNDGIVMFSVYVESVDKVQDEGSAQSGPTALAVQHKKWQGQTHRITVVGEVPAATLQRIAQSVELL